ncbi:hypothetical protein L226DRAFT_616499 [Lentinus tigrinus ALCF2SS1-7]|uniref:DUF4139 domain-containing protein n=1 Tax=Lentinus tigrinus ALCF2SS1-6 TaxID=1328759 RepID=A0A5C2RT41_9APHY|nr:hypothetical protein L227DRAFT_555778 [Lentinus tigrinus ALCF2SS1-6]RPD69912.1 hypothetical protein L226DRAFT_616499 [Lentinus tigrinus ALCF2SS1-7]
MISSSSNKISLNAAAYPIKAVTIFQSSSAELTRTITVDLTSGRNVLEITGISSRVDTESPRIHGLGQDARVFDISCDTNLANAPGPRTRKDTETLKEVTSKIQALELERDVRRTEYDTLDDAVKSMANGKPAELDGFMENFVRRKRAAKQAVWECDQQIATLTKELWLLTDATRGETAGRVVATILAKRECKVAFQLTYLVAGVSWTPYYDLHASTSEGRPSPEICLLYCANITQDTGEDWDDTVLTLSTANSQALRNLSVPVLDPLRVSPLPQPAPFVPASAAYRMTSVAAPAMRVAPQPQRFTDSRPSDDERERAREVTPQLEVAPPTTVDRNPLSLSYHVEGLVTLPSDGVPHKVSIAILDFTAELKYVCAPRKNTSAFIEGTIKNTSEYELLAGPVSVFMDEGFVTKTAFKLISVNESFDCVLGIDTALRVTYDQKSQTEHEPARSFTEPTKTTTRTVTTTASNKHSFDIANLVIRDTIPLGNEDANIKVMLRKPDGLAQTKDGEEVTVNLAGEVKEGKVRWSKVENGKGGEKDGMYEWVLAVPAGKKVTLEAEWAIKAPSNVKWEVAAN